MRGALVALVVVASACGRFGFDTRPPGDGGADDGSDGGVPMATCMTQVPTGTVIHVDATKGNDANNGSGASPVQTITRGLALAPQGATVLVEPGTYSAEPMNEIKFDGKDIKLVSAQRYRASFPRIECFTCDGFLIEGFEITGTTGVCAQASFGVRVTLRDNVIHGCGSAAVRFAGNIAGSAIVGNVIYDAPNALVHVNDDSTVDIVDNVLFDSTPQGAYPAIWMEGTINTVVARNVVFHSKHESAGYSTVSIGHAQNLLIENNIVGIGEAADNDGAVGLDDADGTATIRFNTFIGPFSGSPFALAKNAGTTAVSTLMVTHNIWYSPVTTAQQFSTASETGSDGFTLDRNDYWNGGGGAFSELSNRLGPADDPRGVAVDPQLAIGAGAPPAPPVWSTASHTFADGSTTTCDVRTKLIDALGRVPAASPIAGRAMIAGPSTDIRGKQWPMPASLGAYEP